jgi:hypothetical protein
MRQVSVIVSIVAVVLVGLLGPGRLTGLRAQEATPASGNHPLVGSWEVQLAFEGQGPVELTNLITFGGEGVVLAASGGQLPGVPAVFGSGLVLTEGHGAWEATGERGAVATFRFLTLDQVGGISSTNTASMTVEIDAGGDAFAGSFALDSVSPDGNPMGSGRGTLRAVRIGIEPMASPVASPPASPVASPVASPAA